MYTVFEVWTNGFSVMFQACLVLQKRHLPDRPLEYLLKLRTEVKGVVKYREKWITAGRLRTEFAVGAALINLFEASKVGQLAVDTYLTKRRSLPSPLLSADKQNHHSSPAVDVRQKNRSVESAGQSLKRKGCDLEKLHASSNGVHGSSSQSFRSNCVTNSNGPLLCGSKGTVPCIQKPSSFYGATAQPGSTYKNFTKRLLLTNTVPRGDLSKSSSAEKGKLPDLVQNKPVERQSTVASCKYEDSDSEDDVLYSLAVDDSDLTSDNEDNADLSTKPSGCLQKKQRKLSPVTDIKRNKNAVVDIKQPKIEAKPETKFTPSSLSSSQTNCKAGTAPERIINIVYMANMWHKF